VISKLEKAITDLKVATALGPTPSVLDVPRILAPRGAKFRVMQAYQTGTVNVLAGAINYGTVYLTLSNLPNASAFGQLFDAYRVEQMTVRFIPGFTGLTAGNNMPLLTVIDYDDGTPLTTTSAAYQYDTLMDTPLGHYVERTLVPKVPITAYNAGAATGTIQGTGWVDCASTGVPWYGVKWVQAGGAAAINYAYSIDITAVLVFKSIR